jgi:hypothetical protein
LHILECGVFRRFGLFSSKTKAAEYAALQKCGVRIYLVVMYTTSPGVGGDFLLCWLARVLSIPGTVGAFYKIAMGTPIAQGVPQPSPIDFFPH